MVCAAMGLNKLSAAIQGKRLYYERLVYNQWVLFDDKLCAIKGVNIGMDITGVIPIR